MSPHSIILCGYMTMSSLALSYNVPFYFSRDEKKVLTFRLNKNYFITLRKIGNSPISQSILGIALFCTCLITVMTWDRTFLSQILYLQFLLHAQAVFWHFWMAQWAETLGSWKLSLGLQRQWIFKTIVYCNTYSNMIVSICSHLF